MAGRDASRYPNAVVFLSGKSQQGSGAAEVALLAVTFIRVELMGPASVPALRDGSRREDVPFLPAMKLGSQVRRRLHHPRIANAIYFVTWRLRKTQHELLADERQVVVAALRHFDRQRYDLYAYVVMNDHVHVVVSPRAELHLAETVRSWKSYTANRLQREHQREGGLWQRGYFERIVRDESELFEKLNYISNNPRKRWPGTESYTWVWINDEMSW